MDINRFSETRTGQLVPIRTEDGPDHAFIPDPLPPNWTMSAELWPLLLEARELLGRLDEKGNAMRNPSLLLQPLQKREALRSSSMEGTFATAKELLLFELGSRDPASRDDRAREVANYDQALRFGAKHLADRSTSGSSLSKHLIREMHAILMNGVRGHDGYAGQFRNRHVYVGSGRRYVAPPPGDILTASIDSLENFIQDERASGFDPLVRSYLVHYQFEAIHPFRDGNGRIGRLLLALTTWLWCGLRLPWLYMSAFFERHKDEYIENLFRLSTHGDWDRWIRFCLTGTIEQCKDAMRKCDALNNLRENMRAEVGHKPRLANIVENLFLSPVFTSIDVSRWGGDASLPTARRDIEELERRGWIRYLDGEKPRYYFVPGIMAISYKEGPDEGTASAPGLDDMLV